MSHRQFGTLKYIREHHINTGHVRQFNLTTFGSLFDRGWIKRSGSTIQLTETGEDQYQLYARAQANFRKVEAELSERVALMLSVKVHVLERKKAS